MDRPIAKFVKAHSNHPTMPWPVAWAELACGHTAQIRFASIDDQVEHAHDEAYYLSKIGDVVACKRCDWYADRLAQIRAMKPGDVEHSRFRHRDSRDHGPGDYYVYGLDPRSPTGVHLLFSIEGTPEAAEALRALHASPLSPTESR